VRNAIGDPSCKKSPATKPVFTVFKEIEREDKAEYAKQRMMWEGKEIAFNEQKKDYLEACKQGLLANDAVCYVFTVCATTSNSI
jgi:hypothetical protein